MKLKDIIKLADFFTIGNLVFGMLTIFAATEGALGFAASCLFIAVIFDALDGKVARMTKSKKESKAFGEQLDSLADIVSFGVAPAVFGYVWIVDHLMPPPEVASGTFLLLCTFFVLITFTAAGMLRLARFNITQTPGYFEGVPITVNGILFPLLYLIYSLYQFNLLFLLAMYLVMTYAMISTHKVKKW